MKRFDGAQQDREKLQRKNAIISRKAQKLFLAKGQEGNPDVIDWDEYTIIGTCQTLEKRYLRLTSVFMISILMNDNDKPGSGS